MRWLSKFLLLHPNLHKKEFKKMAAGELAAIFFVNSFKGIL
ncbi:hypothetical protein SAMN05661012_01882 [Chitinophaga sancti]|uniref:Uncharacterized protein n=1 Tax=Chitinophaga sancti TaxID=1004 RepID=A0A1K1PEF1_9BACT|nr:hypothetical protein SAMN05661012_01882 [Chitinophaga sancti]